MRSLRTASCDLCFAWRFVYRPAARGAMRQIKDMVEK
jgi:hypothetical protein